MIGSVVPPGLENSEASLWDRLVAAAVLGTERRPFTGLQLGGSLGRTAAAAAASAGFGGAVATVWAYLHAGRSARTAGPAQTAAGPAPAPVDPRPLLPAGSLRTLAALLEDVRLRPVLPEWLQMAAADGRRLPPEWLPDLLETLGPARGPVRDALEAAAGPRLPWLTARNPAWSVPGPAAAGGRLADRILSAAGERDIHRVWSAATDEQRITAFAAVRRSDPAAALRLAEQVWPDEPGSTRAALVASFRERLSPDDEPFLEARLDDRRSEVRREAALLLGGLPGSRLGERMAARALPHVRIVEAAVRSLQISLPAEVDASARRDGIATRARGRHATDGPDVLVPESERGALLVELMAATPLAAWESHLATAAEDLIGLAASSSEGGSLTARLLLDGWSRAAARQRDARWARALLDGGARPDAGLVALAPPAVVDRTVVAWLQRRPLAQSLAVLAALPAPWSYAVSGAVLERVADLVRSGDTSGAGPVREAVGPFAVALHPGQAPAAAALGVAVEQLPDGPRAAARLFWARQLTQMAAVVHFRQAMYQEFR